jgi:hypothetical protein
MTKVAMPTDEHFPYQDNRARNLAMRIVSDFNPDLRICGSDGMDFYALSKFDKDPKRMDGLQNEVDQWIAGQKEWRDASPNALPFFLVGNHEDRLRKYLWKHPELSGLRALELPNLLEFEKLGIETNETAEYVLYKKLLIRHGLYARMHSGYSAKAELEKEFYSISILTGHTHRGGSIYATTRNGVVEAHECFCLCTLEPEYIQHPNWQQGIVLAEVTSKSLSVESIPFFLRGKKLVTQWRDREYIS